MLIFILFFLLLFIYSIFSYSLVDPNLVLSSNHIYWNFQQWMWTTFFSNGKLMAYIYFFIVIFLYILYFHILERFDNYKKIFKFKNLLIFLVIISPIFISYNALSHDIFNYIFNARMIVVYGTNSYKSVALDFPNDLWTRFMHNTDMIMPYGKFWTYSSVIPYLFGFGKFTLTLAAYRIWNLFAGILLYLGLQDLSKSIQNRKLNFYELSLMFFNPLFLLEFISNYHNDLWMMVPAVFAMSYLIKSVKIKDLKKKRLFVILSLVFLIISITTKLVTLVLLPIWFLVIGISVFSYRFSWKLLNRFKIKLPQIFIENIISSIVSKFFIYLPDLAAFLMFIPLFTQRSKQFLPWYMLWVFVWTPLMKIKIFKNLLIVFTLSSSLRYLPWLFNNMEYNNQIIYYQKLITWMIPAIFLFTNLSKKINFRKNKIIKL